MGRFLKSDTGKTILGVILSIGLGLVVVLPVLLLDALSKLLA